MSDGLLCLIAVAAMHEMREAPSVLLLDEIENGLHPRLLRGLVAMLEDLTKRGMTQVIATTHSPITLNDVSSPESVLIVTRRKGGGVQVTPMSEAKGVSRPTRALRARGALVQRGRGPPRAREEGAMSSRKKIEAWALGDAAAVRTVAGKGGDATAIPRHPEEMWGDEQDRASGHPKCLLRRALGRNPTPADFAALAEESNIDVLRAACPASFAPFVEEAERARDDAGWAGELERQG